MSQFDSGFWDVYIAIVSVVSIVACAVFLWSQSVRKVAGQVGTTGHTWDEDLAEYNNPLPRWWSWLFYLTVVFALVYLVLYPGLGSWPGTLGWTQVAGVIGHDFGASVAAWCALIRPDLFRSMVIMSAPFWSTPTISSPMARSGSVPVPFVASAVTSWLGARDGTVAMIRS